MLFVPYMVPQKTDVQSKININAGLKDELVKWLKTDEARKLGYQSQAQFATEAVRRLLQQVSIPTTHGIHFILPNKEDKRLSLDLDITEEKIVCNICNAENCIHVKTLYDDKYVKQQLKNHKIKLPSKKNS